MTDTNRTSNQIGERKPGDVVPQRACSKCGLPCNVEVCAACASGKNPAIQVLLELEYLLDKRLFTEASPIRRKLRQAIDLLGAVETAGDDQLVWDTITQNTRLLSALTKVTESWVNGRRVLDGIPWSISQEAREALKLRPAEEPARELSASEAASFAKTLARSPRRVEPTAEQAAYDRGFARGSGDEGWYQREIARLRKALSAISTNTLKSSTNKHPQYVSGVAHGLGIAADMARTALTQDLSQPARQSPQGSVPTVGAPTAPAAPGSPVKATATPGPDLACDGFVPDPHSRFCDKCGYPEREHRRQVNGNEHQ